MLTEQVQIKRVSGNQLILESREKSQCSGCSLRKGCGHRLLDRLSVSRESELTAGPAPGFSLQGLQAGDQVLLGVEEGMVLKGVALLYGLPLAGLIVGALSGWMIFDNEAFILLCTVLGVSAAFKLAESRAARLEQASLSVSGLPDQASVDRSESRTESTGLQAD